MTDPVQMQIGGDQTALLMEVLRKNYDGSDIFLTLQGNGALIVSFPHRTFEVPVEFGTKIKDVTSE